MFEFTKEQKEEIMNNIKGIYTLISKLDVTIDEQSRVPSLTSKTKYSTICYCNIRKGEIFEGKHCKYCGKYSYYTFGRPKDVKMIKEKESSGEWKRNWNMPSNTETNIGTYHYVCKNPNEEFGLMIVKFTVSIKSLDDEKMFDTELKIKNIIYVNSGKESIACKISRKKEVEMDFFDAFNINSKTTDNDVNIIWENSNGMLDFLLKNKDICKRYGILECFNMTNLTMPRNAFFMIYMFLYCKFPVIELLVKMDNYSLVSKMMENLASGYNKENIRTRSKEFNKLINPEATKGYAALRMPKYISDFCANKDANIEEYLNWCDIYDMIKCSKEQFEEFIQSDMFYVTSRYGGFNDLNNVLRYGYKLDKLIRYIDKQSKGDFYYYRNNLNLLDDYRNMCNIMEVEAEEYPGNLRSVHDNAQIAYRANKDKLNDKVLYELAIKAEKLAPSNEEYCIVLPKSVADFMEEGNRQHNCVSSYARRVIAKECVVFFIRKKDNPKDSFITAEFRYGRLNQIKYKNNVSVNDPKIVKFANEFCNKLRSIHLI